MTVRDGPLPVLALLADIIVGLAGYLFANYHWARSLDNLSPLGQSRWWVKTNWGVFSPRENFTPAGLRHRRLALLFTLLFAASIGAWFALY